MRSTVAAWLLAISLHRSGKSSQLGLARRAQRFADGVRLMVGPPRSVRIDSSDSILRRSGTGSNRRLTLWSGDETTLSTSPVPRGPTPTTSTSIPPARRARRNAATRFPPPSSLLRDTSRLISLTTSAHRSCEFSIKDALIAMVNYAESDFPHILSPISTVIAGFGCALLAFLRDFAARQQVSPRTSDFPSDPKMARPDLGCAHRECTYDCVIPVRRITNSACPVIAIKLGDVFIERRHNRHPSLQASCSDTTLEERVVRDDDAVG